MTINKEKPNILLITIDCLRPDHLGCYNPKMQKVSPNINHIGKEGVLFKRAFAQGPATLMSFPSIISGTYPLSYGGPSYLINDRPHVAEILKENGYYCCGFQTNYWLSFQHNYPRGFNEYFEYYYLPNKIKDHLGHEVRDFVNRYPWKGEKEIIEIIKSIVLNHLLKLQNGYLEYLNSIEEDSIQIKNEISKIGKAISCSKKNISSYLEEEIGINIEKFISKIKKNQKSYISNMNKFMFFIKNILPKNVKWYLKKIIVKNDHLLNYREKPYVTADTITEDAIQWMKKNIDHSPYFMWIHYMDVHPPYIPGSKNRWPNEMKLHLKNIGAPSISERQICRQEKKFRSYLYDACINYVDHYISKIFDFLNKEKKNTVIIITADHGEEFWEHSDNNHLAKLYDELIHVPLIFYDTKGQLFKNESVDYLIGHIDIIPILINRLNLNTHVATNLTGQNVFEKPRNYILSETLQSKERTDSWNGENIINDYKIICIRTKTEKLIYYERENNFEYFNLLIDPEEKKAIKLEWDQDKVSILKNIISKRLNDINAHCEIYKKSIASFSNIEETELIKKNLKALGYS